MSEIVAAIASLFDTENTRRSKCKTMMILIINRKLASVHGIT